mgnify:CR=1 FL=1
MTGDDLIKLYPILEKAVNDYPGKHVAVTEEGEIIVADSREELLKTAKSRGLKKLCIGHGEDRQIKHFIY